MAEKTSIEELLSNLKIAIQKKSDVTEILLKLSKQCESNDIHVSADLLAQLVALLEKPEVTEKTAELIASLAKTESNREALTDQKLISKLCQLLQETISKKNNASLSLIKQICRALGNLCYENDDCRKFVLENSGLKVISDVVRHAVSLGDTDVGADLRACSVGFLLNFVAGNEDVYPMVLESDLKSLLCDVLDCGVTKKENESAAVHCLIIFGVFADSDPEPILNQRMCNTLVKVLRESTSGELVELSVELMNSQAEHDAVSLNLAKAGLCELLIQLLEKHKNLADDVDTRNLFKMACDLIIIILNDDESMELLYDNGKGNVFVEMVSWLSSSVKELQVTGILAIGNFARADDHCIEMVKQGISKKLLDMLSKNNTDKGDMKLQHALLSALRNLVIPDQNKTTVTKDGLLDVLYPMLSVNTFPVVFKLLGTLRIVVDKQESIAHELGCKKDLIQKVVEWSLTKDHPGVQGESIRFLAWIVKNCRKPDVLDVFIQCNAVPQMVEMIVSDHEVMQNEGLLAVTILSTVKLDLVEKVLLDSKIGEKIVRLLKERKPKKEVFINVLTLIRQLSSSNNLKQHLRKEGVSSAISDFAKTNETVSECKTEIAQVTKLLESG
ncbi:GTPase-GDP dissociation stimulator vimar [Planococcus citri]|uniref:GTPase-GDP dissociation stimulator vimar n=1 Tax=Planococcus citri TaxID=170843 RepID=UPI0031F82F97